MLSDYRMFAVAVIFDFLTVVSTAVTMPSFNLSLHSKQALRLYSMWL